MFKYKFYVNMFGLTSTWRATVSLAVRLSDYRPVIGFGRIESWPQSVRIGLRTLVGLRTGCLHFAIPRLTMIDLLAYSKGCPALSAVTLIDVA